MKRLCIFGNSHVAAVKEAWGKDAQASAEATFVAGSGPRLIHAIFEDGAIYSKDAGLANEFRATSGVERITLSRFDCLVLYGITLQFRDMMKLVRRHAPHYLRQRLNAKYSISEACYRAAVSDMAGTRAYAHIGNKLVRNTDLKVLIVPPPCPSIQIVGKQSQAGFAKLLRDEDPVLYREYQESLKRTIFDGLLNEDGRVTILHQPQETLTPAGFTIAEYCRDGIGLARSRKDAAADVTHMNEKYGSAMIKTIFAELSKEQSNSG